FRPSPRGDHAEPFQRAMCAAPTPPAAVNAPATMRSPAGVTAIALTGPLVPIPRGDHDAPFHLSSPYQVGSPKPEPNAPPARSSRLGATARALTCPGMPGPSAAHSPLAGFQVATLLVTAVPASRKRPPMASTGGRGPVPSGSHTTIAFTRPPVFVSV